MPATRDDALRLARDIRAVCDAHPCPILANFGEGHWRIVDGGGGDLSDDCATPELAWESAAERVKA